MRNTDPAKAVGAARLWLAWNPLQVEPCPAAVADAITEWAEAVVGAEARNETPAAGPALQMSKSRRSAPKTKALTEDETRRQATFKLPIEGGKKSGRQSENASEQPAAERSPSTRQKAS